MLQDLEAFWDSEVPRIGEPNAAGWTQWDRHSSSLDLDAFTTFPSGRTAPAEPSQLSDAYVRWFTDEFAAEMQDSRPVRALDLSQDDEDPFRVIMFEDISPFLFVIQSPAVKLQLAYAAINVFGVPLVPSDVGSDSPFYTDPHLSWSQNTSPARLWPPMDTTTTSRISYDASPDSLLIGDCPIKAWATDRETVCPDVAPWFTTLDTSVLADADIELVV